MEQILFFFFLTFVIIFIIIKKADFGALASQARLSSWKFAAHKLDLDIVRTSGSSLPGIRGMIDGHQVLISAKKLKRQDGRTRFKTKFTLKFSQKLDIDLGLFREGYHADLTSRHNLVDVQIGSEEFDRLFMIIGRDPQALIQYLNKKRQQSLIWFFQEYINAKVSESGISWETSGLISDVKKLILTVKDFLHLSEVLTEESRAHDLPPPVNFYLENATDDSDGIEITRKEKQRESGIFEVEESFDQEAEPDQPKIRSFGEPRKTSINEDLKPSEKTKKRNPLSNDPVKELSEAKISMEEMLASSLENSEDETIQTSDPFSNLQDPLKTLSVEDSSLNVEIPNSDVLSDSMIEDVGADDLLKNLQFDLETGETLDLDHSLQELEVEDPLQAIDQNLNFDLDLDVSATGVLVEDATLGLEYILSLFEPGLSKLSSSNKFSTEAHGKELVLKGTLTEITQEPTLFNPSVSGLFEVKNPNLDGTLYIYVKFPEDEHSNLKGQLETEQEIRGTATKFDPYAKKIWLEQ